MRTSNVPLGCSNRGVSAAEEGDPRSFLVIVVDLNLEGPIGKLDAQQGIPRPGQCPGQLGEVFTVLIVVTGDEQIPQGENIASLLGGLNVSAKLVEPPV